jgi:hypothetical protein
MKLSEEDIRKLYQASADEKRRPGDGCPSLDSLLASFSEEASEEEKLRTADHIAGCGPCRRMFETAREILKGAAALAGEAEGATLSEDEAAELKRRAAVRMNELAGYAKPDRSQGHVGRMKAFSFRYRFALVAAGLVMIIAAGLLVLRMPRPESADVFRGEPGPALVLMSPRGVQKMLPQHFQWQPYSEAEEYRVKLLDEELDVVWDSGPIRETSLDFPADLAEGLKRESVYYWKVTAFLADGTTQESDLQEFRIQDRTRP